MIVLAAVLACALETGLDPACMRTSIGVSSGTTTLSAGARQSSTTIDLTHTWHGKSEFDVRLPFADRLTIANFAAANGGGDLGISFRARAGTGFHRWDQTFGAALTLPTGSLTFTNGRATFGPEYSLTYHARPTLSLIGIADYVAPFGGTKLAFQPVTQRFDLRGRILGETRRDLYAALEAGLSRISGDQRYDAYDARATVGAVVRRRYNVAFWYAQPFSQFTKDHVFERAWGLLVSFQR